VDSSCNLSLERSKFSLCSCASMASSMQSRFGFGFSMSSCSRRVSISAAARTRLIVFTFAGAPSPRLELASQKLGLARLGNRKHVFRSSYRTPRFLPFVSQVSDPQWPATNPNHIHRRRPVRERSAYIPRYRKVDDEERSISAHPQNWLDLCLCYDRVRRGSRTYQNVQVTKFLFPVVKSDGSAPHGFSQDHCSFVRAIRDKQLLSSARLKTSGRSLARLAGT
jgi:hypothetical protein